MSESLWKKLGGLQNDGLFRHSVTNKIKFRKFREGAGEIDRSCRTTSLERARAERDKMMVELWGEEPKKAKRPTAGDLWPGWQQGIKITRRIATFQSVHSSWKHLKPYIGDMFLEDITNEWWTSTYIPRKRDEIAPKTGKSREKRKFANDKKWLTMFLNGCDENGKTPANWRKPKFFNPDPPTEIGKEYSADEITRLMANTDWLLKPKIIMGHQHCMRRSEIALLPKSQIDRVKRIIYLTAKDTKIKKPRQIPYNDALEACFVIMDQKHAELKIVSPWLFPSPIDPSKSIGRDGFAASWASCKINAKVKGRFHDLRHTGISEMVRRPGSNLAKISKYVGASVDMLMKVYVHITTDDLRELVSTQQVVRNSGVQ